MDLSSNQLCGLNVVGRGIYNAEGITAIADALRVNASLTSLSTAHNNMSGVGAQQLAAAVLAKPTLKVFSSIPLKELRTDSLTTLDLQSKGLGAPEAIVLADLLRSVSGSLTKIQYVFAQPLMFCPLAVLHSWPISLSPKLEIPQNRFFGSHPPKVLLRCDPARTLCVPPLRLRAMRLEMVASLAPP